MHAKRWIERGHHVNIVTSFPNFPDGKVFGGYRQSLFKRETLDTVDVLRVPTLVFPNRGIVLRILDFLSFMVTGSIALAVRRPSRRRDRDFAAIFCRGRRLVRQPGLSPSVCV